MKKYQKHNGRYFAGALISILISTVFAVVLQFFKGQVLDYAVMGEYRKTLLYTVLLVLFILWEVLFYYFYKLCTGKFVTGCTKELKQDIFESILRRGYVAYKEHPQGEYIAKLTNEAGIVQDRQFAMLPMFWEILFKIAFVSIALFALDWRIALITIALLSTPLYIPKIIEKPLQNAQASHIQAVEQNLANINDWLSGFEIIKNYSIEGIILEKFRSANDVAGEKQLHDAHLGAISQLITTLISYLAYFIVLAFAAWLVIRGDFSAGDFFVAIGMIDQLSYPLISLAAITRQLIAVKPVCAEMEAFLQAPASAHITSNVDTIKSEITFRDVTFSYDETRLVLNQFNLTLKKGKKYLLEGPSGCGKTTAVNLLLKYFASSEGQIEIDGVPLSEIGSTYSLITVVRQEATLFHDTLRNNLTMYQDISDDKLFAVLCSVGLSRYANTPALNRLVMESGSNFSGGEKKRICLARALLRNTDVLIFDEPLANLDPETAAQIEDLLLSIQDKTVLVVTHQFSEEKRKAFNQVVNFTIS